MWTTDKGEKQMKFLAGSWQKTCEKEIISDGSSRGCRNALLGWGMKKKEYQGGNQLWTITVDKEYFESLANTFDHLNGNSMVDLR